MINSLGSERAEDAMARWRKEDLTPEQDAYLTFSHVREYKAVKGDLDAAKSALRWFEQYGEQCIMSKMTGKPCPAASYTIKLEPPSRSEPHKPSTVVWRHKVPSWVPADVQFLVCDFWTGWPKSPQEIEIIQRLLADSRMEAVWYELLRKDQGTGDYKYVCQSMKSKLGSVRANEVFPASTAIVFLDAFRLGRSALEVNKQKSLYYLEQKYGRREDAELLRRMFKQRRLKDVSRDDVRDLTGALEMAADAYERLTELAGLKFAGSRLFDNPQLVKKGFAVTMAKTMRGLYGHVLYSTVATTANVTLDDDGITPGAVRKWCTP